jgi:hypothetical protein
MKVWKIAAIAVCAVASSAGATWAGELTPACDSALRKELVASLEARVIPGSVSSWTVPSDRTNYKACFQARTQGGGFTTLIDYCIATKSGEVVFADLIEHPKAGDCDP